MTEVDENNSEFSWHPWLLVVYKLNWALKRGPEILRKWVFLRTSMRKRLQAPWKRSQSKHNFEHLDGAINVLWIFTCIMCTQYDVSKPIRLSTWMTMITEHNCHTKLQTVRLGNLSWMRSNVTAAIYRIRRKLCDGALWQLVSPF